VTASRRQQLLQWPTHPAAAAPAVQGWHGQEQMQQEQQQQQGGLLVHLLRLLQAKVWHTL
jgi:hypothetical protein